MPLRFSDDRPPIPPIDLIARVVDPFGPEGAEQQRTAFDAHPPRQLQAFERALAVESREFAGFERLLDFGCGPGRLIRHLGPLSEHVEIHGADIDAQAIAWLRENVPFGTFEVAPHQPPTGYPDHFFDVVINHSVFTHLPADLQDAWLEELRRITRPGALLLLTVQSLTAWNQALAELAADGEDPEPYRAELESRGHLFIAHDHFVGSAHPDWYHTAFHAPWYVFEHWTRFFDVAAYLPHGSDSQDLVLLRRRADDAPQPRAVGHAAAPAAGAPAAAPTPAAPAAAGGAVLAAVERLGAAVAARTPPQSPAGRVKRRVLSHEIGRQDRIDGEIVDVLHELAATIQTLSARGDELAREVAGLRAWHAERAREIAMLRSGLYEQGRRISLLADPNGGAPPAR